MRRGTSRAWLPGVVAGVCLGLLTMLPSAWAQDDPIRLGLLYPISGVYTFPAKHGVQGAQLAFEEAGYRVAGRDIEVTIEDTRAPDVAHGLSKARKLVERDQVDALMGIIWSPTGIAVAKYAASKEMPLVVSEAAARVMTQELHSPYVFRISFAAGQMTYPFGKYTCGQMGHRRVMIVSFESVFARELAEAFENGCAESDGQVVAKVFAPLQTSDYVPYLSRIRSEDPDAVWALFAGSAAVRFLRQYSEFGMKDDYPLLAFGATTSSEILAQVPEESLGAVSNYFYSPTLDNEENRRFVKSYRAEYGEDPAIYAAGGYIAAQFILRALEQIDGRIEQKSRFMEALRDLHFDSPRGPIRLDDYQNAVSNVYVLKAVRSNGSVVNEVVHTFSDVEQYWPDGKPMK